MAIYDSLGEYILFSSESDAKTRLWSRDTNASNKCVNQAKLKYHVLKNPPATMKMQVPSAARITKTVKVGNVTYAIDPVIYDELIYSLNLSPVYTLEQLQERIKIVRIQTNKPPPLNVLLKDVPLRGVFQNRQYNSIGDKWENSKVAVAENKRADVDFKVGNPININIENFPFIKAYQALFIKGQLVLQNAQYIFAQVNVGCAYTGKTNDLFGVASRAGARITAIQSRQNFFKYGILSFEPVLTVMVPSTSRNATDDYPTKFGVLVSITPELLSKYNLPSKPLILDAISKNSELIFIPLQTQLDRIENIDYPVGTGVDFPVTNGGDFKANFKPQIKSFKKLLKTATVLAELLLRIT